MFERMVRKESNWFSVNVTSVVREVGHSGEGVSDVANGVAEAVMEGSLAVAAGEKMITIKINHHVAAMTAQVGNREERELQFVTKKKLIKGRSEPEAVKRNASEHGSKGWEKRNKILVKGREKRGISRIKRMSVKLGGETR
jgi:hypothetical protein